MAQIADGITYLHEHGIVHRNLKPENLLIGIKPNGSATVKIADFGFQQVHRDR